MGEILMAKRSANKPKDNHPNKWTLAVAGTVEEGETYEDNMAKEIEEELGVKIDTTEGKKFFRDTSGRRFFVQSFLATVDLEEKDFTIQKDEVAEVRWLAKDEILEKMESEPDFFVPKFDQLLREFEVI
jgi:isopentenyldiphosphate isomerase